MSDKLRAAAQEVLKNAKSLFLGCGDFNHLKKDFHDDGKCPPLQRYNDALAALKAALAEPTVKDSLIAQRPWVGLTDDEIEHLRNDQPWWMVRDIEAKLREKNT